MMCASAGITLGNVDGDVQNRADVVVNITGYGVWIWRNNTEWVSLHPQNTLVLAAGTLDANGTADLVMVSPGAGLYAFMNGTTFVLLHPLEAQAVAVGRFDTN
jgi:hypothetical protein